MKTFSSSVTVRFYDADVAGITFHGTIFRLAHDSFEEFLSTIGKTWDEWFRHPQYACPIRKAEAEYFKPLYPGKKYRVEICVSQLGSSSFTMKHQFINEADELCAVVHKVHVYVDRTVLKPLALPESLRKTLAEYQQV